MLQPLVRRGLLVDIPAWRAESVTAEWFAARCDQAGLSCIGQERICWQNGRYLIDCMSLVTQRGSRWDRPNRVVNNPLFTTEARRMANTYAISSFGAASRAGGA
jgi:hypothetical protein